MVLFTLVLLVQLAEWLLRLKFAEIYQGIYQGIYSWDDGGVNMANNSSPVMFLVSLAKE